MTIGSPIPGNQLHLVKPALDAMTPKELTHYIEMGMYMLRPSTTPDFWVMSTMSGATGPLLADYGADQTGATPRYPERFEGIKRCIGAWVMGRKADEPDFAAYNELFTTMSNIMFFQRPVPRGYYPDRATPEDTADLIKEYPRDMPLSQEEMQGLAALVAKFAVMAYDLRMERKQGFGGHGAGGANS